MIFERTETLVTGSDRYWRNILWYPLARLAGFAAFAMIFKIGLWLVLSVSGALRPKGLVDTYLLTNSDNYRGGREIVEMSIDDIVLVLEGALAELFPILIVALLVWLILGATVFRIDGPGLVRRTKIFWLLSLVGGMLGTTLRSWTLVVDGAEDLFIPGVDEIVVMGLVAMFFFAFYVGSIFVSAPHLRGAIPGARIVL